MTMMVFVFITVSSIMAQWSDGNASTTVFYNGQRGVCYYDNAGYNNNRNVRNNNFRQYRRVERLYRLMSNGDRKCLRRLEQRLRNRKADAWDDGYLSQRDFRRVGEVEREIERLYAKYRFRGQGYNYNNNRGNNNSNRRGSRLSCY